MLSRRSEFCREFTDLKSLYLDVLASLLFETLMPINTSRVRFLYDLFLCLPKHSGSSVAPVKAQLSRKLLQYILRKRSFSSLSSASCFTIEEASAESRTKRKKPQTCNQKEVQHQEEQGVLQFRTFCNIHRPF